MAGAVWDQFYSAQWENRWPSLKRALLSPSHQVARINPYYKGSNCNVAGMEDRPLPEISLPCHLLQNYVNPPVDEHGLKFFYAMDLASIFPVLALEISPQDSVLDMCAGPGGKALIIVEQSQHPSKIWLNEPSRARRERLKKVLREYLPPEIRDPIHLMGREGAQIGLKEVGFFNKILIDAPCSGERHLLQDPKVLTQWTPSRSKNLSQRQYALLASAWLALAPGGRMVYSTCSISQLENDQVVSRLIRKKGGGPKIITRQWPYGEATECGWQILPDRDKGWGPIYFSVLSKDPTR